MKISSFDFFAILSEEEKKFVQERLKKVSLPSASILFFGGDRCGGILLLESGK